MYSGLELFYIDHTLHTSAEEFFLLFQHFVRARFLISYSHFSFPISSFLVLPLPLGISLASHSLSSRPPPHKYCRKSAKRVKRGRPGLKNITCHRRRVDVGIWPLMNRKRFLNGWSGVWKNLSCSCLHNKSHSHNTINNMISHVCSCLYNCVEVFLLCIHLICIARS